MAYLNQQVFFIDEIERKNLPDTPLEFLKSLQGLTVIDIKGEDISRTRVVTTLIHGNEPSGLIACHLWLKNNIKPITNIRIILCNPEAAKTKPYFTNRYVAHSDDLNRFFSVNDRVKSAVKDRANEITKLIHQVSPEAIVDLHNTSGSSPAFSVSVSDKLTHLSLAQLFTNRLILTQLNVGAIMEQDFSAPIVTIECGGANDNTSHQIATNGLHHFFHKQYLFEDFGNTISVLRHPVRVQLKGDASVGFSKQRLTTADITMREDIESLNQQESKKGEFIGWCEEKNTLPLSAINSNGIEKIDSLLENRGGQIYTRQAIQFFMITTNIEIATKDCLFYATLR